MAGSARARVARRARRFPHRLAIVDTGQAAFEVPVRRRRIAALQVGEAEGVVLVARDDEHAAARQRVGIRIGKLNPRAQFVPSRPPGGAQLQVAGILVLRLPGGAAEAPGVGAVAAVARLQPEFGVGIDAQAAADIEAPGLAGNPLAEARAHAFDFRCVLVAEEEQGNVMARLHAQRQRVGVARRGEILLARPHIVPQALEEPGDGKAEVVGAIGDERRFVVTQGIAARHARAQRQVGARRRQQALEAVARAEGERVGEEALHQFGALVEAAAVLVGEEEVAAGPERVVRLLRVVARPVGQAEPGKCAADVGAAFLVHRQRVERLEEGQFLLRQARCGGGSEEFAAVLMDQAGHEVRQRVVGVALGGLAQEFERGGGFAAPVVGDGARNVSIGIARFEQVGAQDGGQRLVVQALAQA